MNNKFIKKWALPFFAIASTFIILEFSLKQLENNRSVLEKQLIALKDNIKEEENHQIYLKRQIKSQNDPAWIELILKRDLGLVPEGQIKIYFVPH